MVDVEAVMMGSFSDTEETPGRVVSRGGKRFKRFRGMALTAADDDREDKEIDIDTGEGVEALTPYKGPLEPLTEEFLAGTRSGLSYCGGQTTSEARANAVFVKVSDGAKERESAHGVLIESRLTQQGIG
ncbi:MAG: IMP dehydrogenase/GMP reductase [Halonotius sp. J07HN4]|nr:MAG: IMP dehydrogenase/GMP reductase [Halonotius sp. J07HN4]